MRVKTFVFLMLAILILVNSGCGEKAVDSKETQTPEVTATVAPETSTPEQTPEPTPPREIAQIYRWDLTHIYPDDEAFQQELEEAENLIPQLSEFKGKLSTEKKVAEFMEQKDALEKKLEKLEIYAWLKIQQNSEDNNAQSQYQQAYDLWGQLYETTAFYEPELFANTKLLDNLLKNPKMKPFASEIKWLRRNADHVAPKEIEDFFNSLSNAADGASNLYSILGSKEIEFPTITDPDGNNAVVDDTNWNSVMLDHPDREYRRKYAEEHYKAYGKYRNTLTQNLENFIQAKASLAQLRNYESAKEASMDSEGLPAEVIDNLINAVKNNPAVIQWYTAVRKKLLNADKIYSSDMYYTIVDKIEASYSYEEAQEIIKKALEPLGEEYQNVLHKALTERWIDVYPSDNKANETYCYELCGVHPYIIANYKDDFTSISTLAQELGNAVHNYESALTQKTGYSSHPADFTCDVVSTVNEMLVNDYMINNARSNNEKLYYILLELRMLYIVFYQQTMFAEFEDAMYRIIEEGGSLNADDLDELWMNTAQKYYGDDVIFIDGFKYAWLRISSFYYEYYVYTRAASVAAACSVLERIESGQEGAAEQYMEFLKSGDSDDTVELLKITGVDITQPSIADALFNRIQRLADQIEEITN